MKYLTPSLLFIFILWVIFDADSGQKNIFVDFAHSIPLGDKIGHLFLYGILSFALNIAFSMKRIRLHSKRILIGACIVFLFAIGEEFTQIAFETRTFDVFDMLCDLIGITLFSYASIFWVNKRRKKMAKCLVKSK